MRTAEEIRDSLAGATKYRSRRTLWTSAELMAEEFPEPRWIVPGILPEGLAILAGRPKLGKSWLIFDWGSALTTTHKALGSIECEQCDALLISLEDSPRRAKGRLAKLGVKGSPNLTIATQWERLHDGGLDDIQRHLDKHKTCRLIGIDTLSKFRPRTSKVMNAYEADVAALEPLQLLAGERNIGIVAVTHTRKAVADDWLDSVSGTSGITGTGDSIIVLKRERGQADAFLLGDGRDMSDYEKPMRFDDGRWLLLDMSAPEARATKDQAAIIKLLRSMNGTGLLRGQIASALGMSKTAASHMLKRMEEAGIVEQRDSNFWHLTV